ncbi:MAG: hypothetical protein ABI812_00695 [Betaproteobacteria bacterium]
MEALRVAVGLAAPWLLGYAWLRALRGEAPSNAWLDWGYAQFAGVLLLTLIIRAVGLAGFALSFRILLPCVLAAAALGAGIAWRRSRAALPEAAPVSAHPHDSSRDPFALRGLAALVLALLLWRVGALAVDVVLRPLFPWDAWTQWATKARVWSQLHAFVPFIGWEQWLTRAPGYTDVAPHYPATVPLLQTWMAVAQGRFDDATMNLPWLAGFVALGCALYGQMKLLRVGTTWALFATYAALSLPLLDTHVALAGYADFHVAAAFALAVLALAAWEQRRERYQQWLIALMVCLLPLLKVPGLAWGAIVVLGVLVAKFSGSWRRLAAMLAGMGVLAVGAAALVWREKIAAVSGGSSAGVLGSLVDNLFLFDNWHLLWYLLPIVVVVARREALGQLGGVTAALAAGGAFLVFLFTGTRVAAWVTDYTTVNRAILHMAPALAAYGALLLWYWALARERVAQAVATPAPSPASAPADSAPAAVAQQAVEVRDGAGQAVAQRYGGRPAE